MNPQIEIYKTVWSTILKTYEPQKHLFELVGYYDPHSVVPVPNTPNTYDAYGSKFSTTDPFVSSPVRIRITLPA